MNSAILFALLAFVGWGTGDIFGGLVSRKLDSYSATFWYYGFALLLSSLYIPFALPEFAKITAQLAVIMMILSILGVIAVIVFYEGIKRGNASLVGTIGSSFAVLSVILSIIFLGDRISILQAVVILVIFIGIVLSGLNIKTFHLKTIFSDKGVPYALTAMILWGIFFTFIRIPVREIGWFWPNYFALVSWPLIYVIMRFKKVTLKLPTNLSLVFFSIFNAVLLEGATYAYNFAVLSGKTAIVAPIAGSYPVLFVILAYFVFKDRLNKQQIAGIILTLVGVVALSFVSS